MSTQTFKLDTIIFNQADEQLNCTVEIKYDVWFDENEYGKGKDNLDILECDIIGCDDAHLIGKQVTLACHHETVEDVEKEILDAAKDNFQMHQDTANYL